MDVGMITALAALGTALVAIASLWMESRRHRFALGVDLVLRLEDQFKTPRMYNNRAKAAHAFHQGDYSLAVNEIDEIINFYEGVAYFVDRGALDRKLAWNFFFSHMYRFNYLAKEYIEKERRRDVTLWDEFLRLYERLLKIECAERIRCGDGHGLTEDDIEQFLREESSL